MTLGSRLIIENSGLCSKYNCSPEKIYELYMLWQESMFGEIQTKIDDEYIKMMSKFTCDLDSVESMLVKGKKQHLEFLFEIEIKKAAGTYEQWYEDICKENEESREAISEFFEEFSRLQKPLNYGNFN